MRAVEQRTTNAPVTQAIRQGVQKAKGGTLFLASRLVKKHGSRPAVEKALSRLAVEGRIERVSPGVYCKPHRNPYVGKTLPSAEELVYEKAKAKGERIEVHGAEAIRMLGLSTQVPMRTIFVTTGRSRTEVVQGRKVELRHLNERYLRRAGTPAGKAVVALNYVGRNEATAEFVRHLLTRLNPSQRNQLRAELPHLPRWMQAKVGAALGAEGNA